MVRVKHLARGCGAQAGYTLIETLVVMSLLLIVIGAIADGFVSSTHAEVDQTARASDQQSARQAMERMRRDIHCASGAIVNNTVNGAGTITAQTLLLTVYPGQCLGVTNGSDGVEWCTAPISANRYAVYRTVTTTCTSSSAVFQVDFITRPDIWTKACSTDKLGGVTVFMPVNRDPVTRPSRVYTLTDTIAMRNDSVSSSLCP